VDTDKNTEESKSSKELHDLVSQGRKIEGVDIACSSVCYVSPYNSCNNIKMKLLTGVDMLITENKDLYRISSPCTRNVNIRLSNFCKFVCAFAFMDFGLSEISQETLIFILDDKVTLDKDCFVAFVCLYDKPYRQVKFDITEVTRKDTLKIIDANRNVISVIE
jgi:hypothetical protein